MGGRFGPEYADVTISVKFFNGIKQTEDQKRTQLESLYTRFDYSSLLPTPILFSLFVSQKVGQLGALFAFRPIFS